MAQVQNFTPPGRITQLFLVILIIACFSSSAGSVSRQQEQNRSGRSNLKISENGALEVIGQREPIPVVKRKVNSDWRRSTSPVRLSQSDEDHEKETRIDHQTSSTFGVTINAPSSNSRLKRDANNGSSGENSTETSSRPKVVFDNTPQSLESTHSPLPIIALSAPSPSALTTLTTPELTPATTTVRKPESASPTITPEPAPSTTTPEPAPPRTIPEPEPTTTTTTAPEPGLTTTTTASEPALRTTTKTTPEPATTRPEPATTTTTTTPEPVLTTSTTTTPEPAPTTTTMTTRALPLTTRTSAATETVSLTGSTISTREPVVCPNISAIATDEVNEGDIVISWTLDPAGDLLRNICVAVASSVGSDVCPNYEQCVDPTALSKTVTDLCHFHEYMISVSIQCLSDEWRTRTVHNTTKTAIPSEPTNLNYTQVTDTTIGLKWSPPLLPNGIIINYVVYWQPSYSKGLSNTTETFYTLKNLQPYTVYNISVSAWTAAGESEGKAGPMLLRTETGLPDSPENLAVRETSNITLTLQWSPPSIFKGVVTNYSVYWKKFDSEESYESRVTTETTIKLENLRSYTNYTLMVSAWTSAGEGPSSELMQQTEVGIPSKPGDLFINWTGPTVLTVTWGKPGEPRGPIDGYILSWGETETETFDTKSGEVQSHEIKGLTPFTNYIVAVVSYNINGRKEVLKSEESAIQAQTAEDIPSAPRDVGVLGFSNTTLSVTWQVPETPNGIVQVYTVYCKSENDGDVKPHNKTTDTKYVVTDLNPFTVYDITISATTSAGEGPKSIPISHKTDVGVPSAPRNVSVLYATDTSIYMEWKKPESQHGPISGFDICWGKLSDEANGATGKDLNLGAVIVACDNLNTEDCLDFNRTAVCKYHISGLDPWANYTFEISAFNKNQNGDDVVGPSVVLNQSTSAAVPEEPMLDSIEVLNSTAVIIRWRYTGHFPGPLSYTVELETDKSVNCISYDKRNVTWKLGNGEAHVTALTPYTNYLFRVYASTEAGSSASNTQRARTNPDVPGPPEDVRANCVYSPTKASLSWRTPKRENGLIEEYKIRYGPKNGEFDYNEVVRKVDQPKLCDQSLHRFELDNLHPEKDYEIVVMAKTRDVKGYGDPARYAQTCVTPAGVPPFPKNDTSPKVRGTNQQEAQLAFSKTTFSAEMGVIRHYAIIVAFSHSIGRPAKGNTSEAREQKLPVWNQFWKQTSDIYQATPEDWNPFRENVYDPLHCQQEPDTEEGFLYCTVGWEKNCSEEEPMYCNGPLIPGKRYGIKLRGFTAGGYSETNPIYIATAPIEPGSRVGIILGLVFLLLLALLVTAAIFLDRRNNFKAFNSVRNLLRRKETSSAEQNVDVDLNKMAAPANDTKTQPMNFAAFLEHVKLMMSDSFLRFSLEYEEIKQCSPKHPCTAAEMEENRMKNRWMNIYPFDHSRVKLLPIDDEPSSDYINANYIPGFTSHREYIATQGPLPSTIDDFWRMVWEQGVTMIVMLTQCVERGKKKCEQYWPADSDNVYYGDLKVQLKSESILSAYCIRIFDLQLGSRQHTVKQMHFTKWPDFGSPESPQDLINFVQAVRDHLPHTNTGPILVHCSAGVGRTGTFIAVDRLLLHIQYHNDINIYNTVVDMREHRTNMVQTEDQYIYIHKCMRDIISQRLHPRTSIYDDDDEEGDDRLYSNINIQQATTEL